MGIDLWRLGWYRRTWSMQDRRRWRRRARRARRSQCPPVID